MIKLFGYKRCGTCRKAEKLLSENGVSYEFFDITVDPPTRSEMENCYNNSDKELKKFFNTSGVVYREEKIKDKIKTMSESEQLDLLASNGKLIKRPIITNGESVTVGYNEDELRSCWL